MVENVTNNFLFQVYHFIFKGLMNLASSGLTDFSLSNQRKLMKWEEKHSRALLIWLSKATKQLCSLILFVRTGMSLQIMACNSISLMRK